MFDFSLGEMAVIGAVALVVLGPEKLPQVARTVGQWLGKAQRYVNDVKSDLNREVELAELRKLQQEVQDSARALEHSVQTEMASLHHDLSSSAMPSDSASTPDWSGPQDYDFVKPIPSLDELAEQVQTLQRQWIDGSVPARFKYAPRARAARRLSARPGRRLSS